MRKKRVLLFFLMLLVSSIAYALNETTVNVKGKVRETIKLELPDPARGYIDYSKWTCDNSNIEFMYKSTGYAQIRIERYFEGVAEIECAYTAKWYDNRGWTNSDSYLRTFYVSCEPDNSELTVKISPSNEQLRIGTQIKLESNNSNASIYYTMDDTSPLEKKHKYNGKLYFTEPVKVRAIAILGNKQSKEVEKTYDRLTDGEITFFTDEGIEVLCYEDERRVDGEYKNYIVIGTITSWTAIDNKIEGTVTLPSMVNGLPVEKIAGGAFRDCHLSEIIIPEGILHIGLNAFNGCTNLRKIYCKSNKPEPIYTGVFDDYTCERATLYVPKGSKDLYSNTKGWEKFEEIVEYDNGSGSQISNITLDLNNISLKEGTGHQLNYTVTPSDCINSSVLWKSDNTNVATVSDDGYVMAKSYGSAIVTCMSTENNSIFDTCEVTVEPCLVERIDLTPSEISLSAGESKEIKATISPSNVTNKDLAWSSSNTSVAKVKDGIVTAVSEGTATITCKATDDSGVTASCQVTVANEIVLVESISVVPETLEIKFTGATTFLDVYINPSNATDRSISCESSDNSIVRVSEHRKDPLTPLLNSPKPLDNIPIIYDITAVSPGIATITFKAKDGSGVCASCVVTVKPSVEEGETVEVNSLLYQLYPSDNTAVVAKQETKLEGDVTIPEKIEYKRVSYTVTEIGDYAFDSQNNITGVNIPATVKKIGKYAFWFVGSLKSIVIPDNVESLGKSSFFDCESLESIYIGA